MNLERTTGTGLSNPPSEFPKFHHFEDGAVLVEALAERIVACLGDAIAERGRATIAVSGGSTPIPLFHQLSLASIDWGAVLVTLVDERWVDSNHTESNEALVRTHLLKNNAASAEFISLKTNASSPFVAEQTVSNRLRCFDDSFDVVLLGMGTDGHTASLFPDSEPLQDALEPRHGESCCGIFKAGLSHPRMTLTLPRILNARALFLHTVGAEKLVVLRDAFKSGDVAELPVRAVLHQFQTPVHVYHADHG